MILLPDYFGYTMADDYASFIKVLVWYRMFCENEIGESREDYKKGLEKLQDVYRGIFQYQDKEPPPQINRLIEPFFEKISSLLESPNFNSAHIIQVANLLHEFESIENSGPGSFRDLCLETRIEADCNSFYPEELFNAVYDLLKAEKHDATIVESFKYLDALLQDILQLPSHENYGENIINAAFSPNIGKLQLNTNANEQIGLRNFISGANAVFRNPSAHRSQFKGNSATYLRQGEDFSLVVVAIISLISRITANILQNSFDSIVNDIFQTIATKNNWSTKVISGFRFWACSPLPDSPSSGVLNYRMRVLLNCEKGDVSLNVLTHESVQLVDAKNIADYLHRNTGFITKLIS